MLIDSHCHLSYPELSQDLNSCLDKMQKNHVTHALCVSTHPNNIQQVIDIANNNKNLFATVGVHPDEKLDDFIITRDFLMPFTKHDKVVAIGETGLDYYWNKDQDLTWQRNRFQVHIDLAKELNLPLVIHCRDAADDVYNMLKNSDITKCGAVIHCFTENREWAKKFLDIGCYISLSGIVTFKSAKELQEVAKMLPLDRMLVETDSPFLAPVPFRGKTNHPALVKHTADFIANLRECESEIIYKQTTKNFFDLFNKVNII